ncbi:uncharacterized protein LOC144472085 [Augochlora pura]
MPEYTPIHESRDAWKHIKGPTVIAAKASVFVALHDILVRSQCKTLLHTLGRFAYYVFPMPGITMAFQAVAYTAADIRNKHDLWNYHLAALFVLPLIRKWTRLPVTSMAGLYLLSADKITMISAMKFADALPPLDSPSPRALRVPCFYD